MMCTKANSKDQTDKGLVNPGPEHFQIRLSLHPRDTFRYPYSAARDRK